MGSAAQVQYGSHVSCETLRGHAGYGEVSTEVAQVSSSCERAGPGGGLPFTGLDIFLLVAVALVLVGVGLALRVASRQDQVRARRER